MPPSSASVLVSPPANDEHILEFGPLSTSPSAPDAVVGNTDGTKKQACEGMAQLVKKAVRRLSPPPAAACV